MTRIHLFSFFFFNILECHIMFFNKNVGVFLVKTNKGGQGDTTYVVLRVLKQLYTKFSKGQLCTTSSGRTTCDFACPHFSH